MYYLRKTIVHLDVSNKIQIFVNTCPSVVSLRLSLLKNGNNRAKRDNVELVLSELGRGSHLSWYVGVLRKTEAEIEKKKIIVFISLIRKAH